MVAAVNATCREAAEKLTRSRHINARRGFGGLGSPSSQMIGVNSGDNLLDVFASSKESTNLIETCVRKSLLRLSSCGWSNVVDLEAFK